MTAAGGGLAQRVAALERQVGMLAAASQGEALQPNYLTVNPDGTTGALFRGGAQMLETGTTPSSTLAWVDAAGVTRESIGALVNGLIHTLLVQSRPDAQDLAQLQLSADPLGVAGTAQVAIEVADSSGANFNPTLIDSLRRSNWLQLPSAKQQVITCGLLTGFNALANSNALYNLGPPASFGFTTQVDAVACAAYPASSFSGFSTVWGVAANGPYTSGSPPQIAVANGATPQAFSVHYVALGH